MSVRDIDLDPDKVFGIGFPLNYDSQAAGFFTQNKKYYQQIQDNIKNLLMTSKGERPANESMVWAFQGGGMASALGVGMKL